MSSDLSSEEATISYPSIALVLGLAYLLYRYFTKPSSSSSSSSSQSARNSNNGLRFTPAQVDQVASMFPQLSRRDIMWDLQRNRGSVNATVERILAGRGLDPAPPSFQPPLPTVNSPQSTSSTGGLSALLSGSRKVEPDLITRYKLHDRITTTDKDAERSEDAGSSTSASASGKASGSSWAATKDERQDILKRRRDEMILEARRKMMEKEAARAKTRGDIQ